MHPGARVPLPESRSFSRLNRRITYLLGPCPGGPRHDGIDYANSRNRPSWLKPLRNYASTPSDSAYLSVSFSLPLCLFLSFSLSLFRPALLCLLSFSSPLFAFHALPSFFFKLIHPLSSFLPFTSPPRMHLKAL